MTVILDKITVPAQNKSLPAVTEMVTRCAQGYFDERRIKRLQLATEEAVTNIFNHTEAGTAQITISTDNGHFIIELRDTGPAFDVVSQIGESSDKPPALKVGGYGMILISKVCDDVQYRREGETNVLKLTVKIA